MRAKWFSLPRNVCWSHLGRVMSIGQATRSAYFECWMLIWSSSLISTVEVCYMGRMDGTRAADSEQNIHMYTANATFPGEARAPK